MKFLSDVLAKAGLVVDGVVTFNNTATGQTPDANDNSTKLATTAWVRTFVQPYSLPIASASLLGGIKVGSGLSIDSGTGVLSVTGAGAASIKSTQTFIATAGQTVFTVSGGYTPGLIDVFLNGVYLSPNQTTATNGTTFTLDDAAAVGDIVDVIVASPIYQGSTITTDQLPEGVVNLYYTNTRARAAISLTVNGTSGSSTYNSGTGVLNVPTYTLAGLGGTPASRTLTINSVGYDLSSDRSWTVGDVRTDSSYSNPSWITSLVWSKISGTPTTLSGYGITNAYTQAQVDSLLSGYVTLATDQTITGLKTIVRSGDVLNFKIGSDTLYGLRVAYNQNELVANGEATWSFVNTFNRNGSGFETTPISFFRGVLVTGERLLSASINSNLLDYYSNNPSGRYPVYAYNTGVQQFSTGIIVGKTAGVVNAATGAIADLPSGVVANFNGRVIGSNAVNSNEFVALGQLSSYVPTSRTLTINGITYDLTANRSWSALPVGGTAGQLLAKVDGTDYNAQWINEAPAASYTSQVKHRVKSSQAITKGQAVYVSSADGTNMIVSKASNATEGTSSKTMGLLESTVAINGTANVVTEGLLAGLDTTGANAAGDPVWLGTDGNLIYGLTNKPSAPAHLVFIGVVTRRNANNGEIFVKVQNGYELDELHDLSVKNPSDGDMIKYVASTGLWTKIAASTTNIVEGTNLYYTQGRFDTAFAAKSTTNLAEGTNLYYTDARVGTYLTNNSYATQSYVNSAVSNLVDAAPGTLDTLNELAAALGDDPNFATTVAASIGTKEPIITAGTTSQYWRGDKTWQTLPIYTLSGLGGQPQLNVTGFVKVSGTTVSYDNSTYYLASNPNGYISSYTETDTLATVTARGATTGTATVFTNSLFARKSQTAGNYTTAALWTESYDNTTTGIAFHINGNQGKFLEMRTNGILYWHGDTVWHSGNLTNLNQLSNGPGYITSYTETDTLASVTSRGASTSSQVSFTKTDDHAISVGTIRGRAVGSQSGEFIQLYERVNIGGPNGWGASNTAAPSYGLSVFGGANIGYGNDGGLTVTGVNYLVRNTASGRSNLGFLTSRTTIGNIHVQNGAGPGSDNANQAAITFQGDNASQAQAGIYVLNNNSYGTSMGFATTNSYDAGPQLFMTATNGGVVNFPRATPTVQGNALLHAGNYTSYTLPIGGSWYGVNLPGSRWGGYAVSGGEIVFGNGLPNAGQMGILIDGAYLAGENNGFWSLPSDNNWNGRRGMFWDGTQLNFTTNSPIALFSDVRAPIFYDSADTSYYLDPNSTVSAVFRGSIGLNNTSPINSAWGNGSTTTQLSIYGSAYGVINLRGDAGSARTFSMGVGDNRFYMCYDNTAARHNLVIFSDGRAEFAGNVHAPLFYDSNDTSFYLDPNSYSRLSRVGVGGGANDVSGININGDGAITGSNSLYFGHTNGSLGSWQTRTFASSGRQIWNTNGFEVNRDGYGGGWLMSINSAGSTTFNSTSDLPININGASHKYVTINPGNGYEAMVRYIGGSGSSWYVGKRTSNEFGISTPDFHFYSEAAGRTVGGFTTTGAHFAHSYQGNTNVGGTGNASWHPSGAYIGGTMWQYGDMYKNNTPIYDVQNIYNSGWYRNYGKIGVYNQTYGGHFYQDSASHWAITGAGTSNFGLQFRSNYDSSIAGYVYGDTGGSFGLLWGGGWAVRTFSGGGELFGTWTSNGDHRAPIFYDSANTAYYIDPNGAAYLASSIEIANGYFLSNGTGGAIFMSSVQGSFGGYMRFAKHAVIETYVAGHHVYVLDSSGVGVVKTSGSQSWAAHSDARIKTVHSVMENNLLKLESINPVYYSFNNFADERNRIGLLAQEVQEHFPELVDIDPKTDNLILEYTGLIPVLLGAIKELKSEVEILKTQLQ